MPENGNYAGTVRVVVNARVGDNPADGISYSCTILRRGGGGYDYTPRVGTTLINIVRGEIP